jgi:hypothetical protein
MNHLEPLVAEWLQYKEYFVRMSVPVGPRPNGGFEGELDIIGLNPNSKHLIHVECSLDSLSSNKRDARFSKKFECGRKYLKKAVFRDLVLPEKLDPVALLQYAPDTILRLGGQRLVTVKQFIREVFDGLQGSPASGAVPSTLPLLRTLQLVAYGVDVMERDHRAVGFWQLKNAAQRPVICSSLSG